MVNFVIKKECGKLHLFFSIVNICPFKQACTVASTCMKVYRKMFLEPDTIGIIPKNWLPMFKRSIVRGFEIVSVEEAWNTAWNSTCRSGSRNAFRWRNFDRRFLGGYWRLAGADTWLSRLFRILNQNKPVSNKYHDNIPADAIWLKFGNAKSNANILTKPFCCENSIFAVTKWQLLAQLKW